MENKMRLHEDLVWEILLRCPVKSVTRFKCVSKSLFFLVSDANFAKLHFEQTASHTPKFVFSVSIVDSSKAQIRYINPEALVILVSPFPSPLEKRIMILDVCRGFILLGHISTIKVWGHLLPQKNLLVWNPSTGIYRTIPYSKDGSVLARISYPGMRAIHNFEYDAFTDDYFLVIAWFWNIVRGEFELILFELFSMRTSSWKQFDATHLSCRKSWFQPTFLFVNGAIHWLSTHNYVRGESIKAINAFDLTGMNYSEIPLPHDGFVYDGTARLDGFVCDGTLRLEVIEGCLCLVCGSAELWIMKEYKVKSSWTKCNYVPPPPRDSFTDGHIYTESLLSLPTDSGQA